MSIMVQDRSLNANDSALPAGFIPLAVRANELGVTPNSLRRYINLGNIDGSSIVIRNRIYVTHDLVPIPVRRRGSYPLIGRKASLIRETNETWVSIDIDLDGQGTYEVATGNPMLNHLLEQFAKHGLLNITVKARGDDVPDAHHLVEDVSITLGRVIRQAVGEGRGICRVGNALVPLDEVLAQVVIDIGGRGYTKVETKLEHRIIGNLNGELIGHFLERLALEACINLHTRVLSDGEPHHVAEALFKSLARAFRMAVQLDPKMAGQVPSTKGTVSG